MCLGFNMRKICGKGNNWRSQRGVRGGTDYRPPWVPTPTTNMLLFHLLCLIAPKEAFILAPNQCGRAHVQPLTRSRAARATDTTELSIHIILVL